MKNNNLDQAVKTLLIAIQQIIDTREAKKATEEPPTTPVVIPVYDANMLTHNGEEFKCLLMEHGRVPFRLSNGSVITVCRPLLCFEQKPDDFKAKRYLVEKQFWENKLADEAHSNDWIFLACTVLELF